MRREERLSKGPMIVLGGVIGLSGLIAVLASSGASQQLKELCGEWLGGGFMPHGHCYLWKPDLLWLHVGSDGLIGLSYFSIPVALLFFASKRREASFLGILILFGSFISLCGLTHILAVYNVWEGAYWISGSAKAATAGVSMATAGFLIWKLPAALSIPLPEEYRKVTQELELASEGRRSAERRLEARISEQTEELFQSDSRWRLLTEFIYSAVWVSDSSGRARQRMPKWEEFTGQSFAEYSGYGWLEAYLESDREGLRNEWERCVATGSTFEYEAHLWSRKRGDYAPVLKKGIPIRDSSGEIHEWLGAVHDLTELKERERTLASYSRRLQAKNKYLQEFAYVASHDLREPLRKICAYGDILKETDLDALSEEGRRAVDVMQSASGRMSELINELLAYSRVSSVDLHLEKMQLDALMDRVEEDLELAIKESEATIHRDCAGEIEGDPVLIQRVLQNLVGNAIKYRSPDRKPEIRVSLSKVDRGALPVMGSTLVNERYYQIEVADNGIGFEGRHYSAIMKPFHRLHSRGEYAGVGMGLAICKRIAERHNGSLQVESEPGKGSVFRLFLPTGT